jgi:hypothetical protein
MVTACGASLAKILADEFVPLLTRMLDRTEFLAMARDPAKPLGDGIVGPEEIMLLIDNGPSAELEAAIAKAEALDLERYPVAPQLVAWARQRLADRPAK